MAKKKTTVVEGEMTTSNKWPEEWKPNPDERQYPVVLTLPMSVLIAVLDKDHPLADVDGALHFGLLRIESFTPSPLGELVAAGCDQTAIRHKMNAEWRRLHNQEIDRRP